jgi:hypothetical protein
LNNGLISYSPVFKETSLGKYYKNKGVEIPEIGFVTYESKDKSSILILFLRFLLNFNLPSISLSSFIIKKYLDDIQTDFKMELYDGLGNNINVL